MRVLLVILTFFSAHGFAYREVIAPTFRLTMKHDLDSRVAPNALPDGTPVAFEMSFKVLISNLSEYVQTGELSMLYAGALSSVAMAAEGAGAALRGMDVSLELCGNVSSHHVNFSVTTLGGAVQHVPPQPATFKVNPKAILELSTSAYFFGERGDTVTPKRFRILTCLFGPTLKIKINEDRGAVIASISPEARGISGGSGTFTSCGGVTVSGPRNFGFMPDSYGAAPLMVNGGRPF